MRDLNYFLSEIDSYSYDEIEDMYADYLDACYEPVQLAGMTIYASEMRSIDPVMFRCGVADYSSEEFEEFEGEYYKKEEFDEAQSQADDIEHTISKIEELCDEFEFEIVSWGLAPNPNGYSFEYVGDEWKRDSVAENYLSELLSELEQGDIQL